MACRLSTSSVPALPAPQPFDQALLERIEQLKEAVQSRVPENIRRAAHAIKGSALNMSLNQMGDLALTMEKAELDLIDGYLEAMQSEWEKVKDILQSL